MRGKASQLRSKPRPTDHIISQPNWREEAVREAKTRYKAIFDNRLEMVYVNDEQGVLLDANDYALQRLGYTRDDLGKVRFQDIVHPEDLPKVLQTMTDILASGFMKRPVELRVITKSGAVIWIETFGITLEQGVDHFLGLAIAHDISDRKLAEQALRQREQDYLILLESTQDCIIVFDAETLKVIFGNRRAELMFGFDPILHDGIGVNLLDFVHPDDKEVVLKGLAEDLYTSERRKRFEVRAKTNDGKEIWVSALATRIEFQGRVAVLLSLKDITETKQTQEALRQSEELYATMANSSQVGIYIVQDRKFVFVNPQFQKDTGFSANELLGTDSLRIVHPDDRETVRENAAKMLKGELDSPYEYRAINRSGRTRVVVERVASIRYGGKLASMGCYMDITERKLAEEALRESEEHYSALVGNLTDGVFKFKGGVISWCNDRVEEIYGYPKAELLGKNASFFYPSDVSAREFTKAMSAAIRERGFFRGTAKFKRKDGSLVDIEYSLSQIPGKEPLELIAIARDITERKRIEEMLRKSEEKLRTYLESSPDGIYVSDLKGTLLYGNRAAEKIVGYQREELLGKSFLELNLLPPKYLTKAAGLLELNTSGSPTGPDQVELIRKDRSHVFVEISTYPIGQGDKTEVIGIARDITERRQIEKALRQSEERFRNVLDNSLDMIYSMNLQSGKYEYVSPSSKKMLGYSPEEFVALGSDELISLVHPVDAEELQQNIVDLITRGENRAVSAEYRVKHKELDYRWVSDNRSVVYDDGNMPVAIVGSLRDVTERKNAEATLKQTMAELTRSNTELEQFAYVASHDLQEPLRMVASYTQLLGRRYKGKLDADADEFIGYAVDGATRMQQLINALLDYSRVGTRGKPFEPTNCEDVFNQVVANLRAAIEENGAVVTHDHLPTVMADSVQIVQLFQNLIGNAIKFHSDKRPEVHVRSERNGTEWVFSVRDNGIGIDPQHFDRIFVIFQRLHGRGEYPGTGIGLAVCKKIVERHKGRIWIESEVGKGSTFYFTIPVVGDKET